jgi:DhnA family fructose-bisphosphate aldolase class Ia
MALSPATFAKRRMGRIFGRDGRALIIAMDHGNVFNVMPALANPGRIIEECVAGGADAILTTFGVAKNYPGAFGPAGLIVRCDSGKTFMPGTSEVDWVLRYGVEDALRLGADGVGCMGFPGTAFETKTLAHIARLAAECERWGVVLMGELLPGGFEQRELHTPDNMALAARFGAETGCDFIKTEYTGSPESFRRVTDACYRPVVVLGGSKKESELEVLKMVKESIDAGGAGVAMGRNVWNHPDPRSFVSALGAIIHRSASVEEAADLLGVKV